MKVTPETAPAELASVKQEIERLTEVRRQISRYLSHPSVTPVVSYFRYHTRYEEDYTSGGYDSARDAWWYLDAMSEEGTGAPDKVTVGGADIPEFDY